MDWRKILGYVVRWLLPLALTVLLVAYMFRKVDFAACSAKCSEPRAGAYSSRL